MPFPQHRNHLIEGIAFGGEEYQVVIHQVGGFAEKKVAVIVFGFDNEFYGFFAHFLGYFIDAPGE
jgi:hypothetical protein